MTIESEPTKKLIFSSIIITAGILSDPNLIINRISISVLEVEFNLNNLSQFFTILCILLFINAFNMLDGLNLLAGVYALFLFVIIYIFKFHDPFLILILIPLCGFIFLNSRNKTFLGDNGSLLLGYLLAVVIIFCHNVGKNIYADEILLLMLFPGLEMVRLSFSRILNNRHAFSPDRNHLHHLLVDKISDKLAIFVILSLIIFPVLFFYIINFKLIYIILLTIVMYISIILYLKSNN